MAAPRATYRLQLTPDFTFDAAAVVADYLAALGVSHVYASPYLQAAPGSTHGYDVVDHHRVNEELGGEDAHVRFCRAVADAGLGQVLDIVPNHMAIGTRHNRWWWDVLAWGRASRYAPYFDVDWDPPERKLRDTILLPILGDHYGRVLEAGELVLERRGGEVVVRYHDHVVPVSPPTLDEVLLAAAERCGEDTLASPAAVQPEWLARVLDESPAAAEAVDAVLAEVSTDPDRLDALLERQHYRLALWRTAGRELDYRRFFDIDTLIGLRVEDAIVFADTHARILDWVKDGVVDGLRVDHPDGLRDPEGYLERLRDATDGAWVVVEKILEPGEHPPSSWPVAGTTGYDFLNVVGGLFVDPAAEGTLTSLYAELTGAPTRWRDIVLDKKHLVMREVLAADVNRLTNLLVHICERHRRYRDYTRHELHEVLREVIASFPVYRTYVRPALAQASEDDRAHVGAAVGEAKARRPDLDPDLFDFLGRLLLLEEGPEPELVERFQQVTGPVTAKGVEDTAFYTFNRFTALNEVGGDPSRFGVGVDEFHAECERRAAERPLAMLSTSTHDTKRSEDVRARLAVLSEVPVEWAAFARRWVVDDSVDANTQYLFLQAVVGAWPLTAERARAYMEKATREAKDRTSWTVPDPEYDEAVLALVEARLEDPVFLADVEALVARVREPGRVNALAQALVKLTAPGVPDVYQGCELWDLSLVDPDNRRPVDYGLRRRLLAELDDLKPEDVLARADEGLPKLLVVHRALRAAVAGDYRRVEVSGERAAHVVAFARGGRHVTVVPRLPLRVAGEWGTTAVAVPEGRWRDVFTGDEVEGLGRAGGAGGAGGGVPVARLLGRFPVALLERVP